MGIHGTSTCQVEGCGLRLHADLHGTWYHDERDLRASGFVPDGLYDQPHEPVPDPDVVRAIERVKEQARIRLEERRALRDARNTDHRADA